MRLGDKSSAVKSYKTAISNDPTRISTYLKLANVQNTASAFKTLSKHLNKIQITLLSTFV